jgi:hypothetical protein
VSSEELGKVKVPDLSREEIALRGQELYQKRIRPRVETEENVGKIISIDIHSGDYEIDDDPVKTADRLRARHPGAVLWTERIGYDAVYAIGGTLTRTTP